MKKQQIPPSLLAIIFLLIAPFFVSCSDDEDNSTIIIDDNIIESITESDKNALIFMVEEEKLARDTYIYLYAEWGLNVFQNISNSEQTHMDAVEVLLNKYDIPYSILPEGEFQDAGLQSFYDQFVADGSVSLINALSIGATIEDLDIVDLQNIMDVTTNSDLITVFGNLQCGSRNHLRSFMSNLENRGGSYTPQFLTIEEFNTIVNSDNEQCNQ
jgi:hypothetical protein